MVIGDLLVDVWWAAKPATRNIEHAAMAIVSSPASRQIRPGGAGIVIDAIRHLPAELVVYSVCGTSFEANRAIEYLQRREVSTENILVDAEYVTPIKTRYLNSNGHILVRHDSEVGLTTTRQPGPEFEQDIDTADIILVADYAKGCIHPETRARLCKRIQELRAAGKAPKVIVDTKPHMINEYPNITAFKLNRLETEQIAGVTGELEAVVSEAYTKLPAGVNCLITTDGDRGVAFIKNGAYRFIKNPKSYQSGNCVGAGDVFLSGLAFGLLALASEPKELSVDDIEFAAQMAMIAAGQRVRSNGKTTLNPRAILTDFQRFIKPFDPADKIQTHDEVIAFAQQQRSKGKTVVFTNGCFDLLHEGHIALLTHSRRQGDVVIVAVDSDAGVRALKGDTRPVQDQATRATNLAALANVSRVCVFDSTDPENLRQLIEHIAPDVLVKGADYSGKTIIGEELVGRVSLCPLVTGKSTTQLVNKLRQTDDTNK
jgi:D-beta-D-heptose 7-phosphate kinase/D-beta-D-heptose 1-phosphate adenosyltransferase